MTKPPAKGTPAKGSGGKRALSVGLRTARGRTVASQRWLARQLNDPYVAAAKAQGWRSRAAFKLIELDEKFHLLKPGQRILDLGAAPGGWTQVAVRHGAGQVVGLDLLAMDPVQGATLLQGDFNDEDMPERLLALLGGKVDLVLSGHIHAPFTWPYPFGDGKTYAVGASTLSIRERGVPPGFNIVDIERAAIQVAALQWTGSHFEPYRTWSLDRR